MTTNEHRVEALFMAAEAARSAELQRALQDPRCWAEQLAVVLVMGMKCVALAFLCASAWVLVGAGKQLALTLGVVLVLTALPFNPRSFFWRVVFVERAEHAFWEHLRLNLPESFDGTADGALKP